MDPRQVAERAIQEKAELILGTELPPDELQEQGRWWVSYRATKLHGRLLHIGDVRTKAELAAEILGHLQSKVSLEAQITGEDSVLVTKGKHKNQRATLQPPISGDLKNKTEYSVLLSANSMARIKGKQLKRSRGASGSSFRRHRRIGLSVLELKYSSCEISGWSSTKDLIKTGSR
jgi:hypothetical protein